MSALTAIAQLLCAFAGFLLAGIAVAIPARCVWVAYQGEYDLSGALFKAKLTAFLAIPVSFFAVFGYGFLLAALEGPSMRALAFRDVEIPYVLFVGGIAAYLLKWLALDERDELRHWLLLDWGMSAVDDALGRNPSAPRTTAQRVRLGFGRFAIVLGGLVAAFAIVMLAVSLLADEPLAWLLLGMVIAIIAMGIYGIVYALGWAVSAFFKE